MKDEYEEIKNSQKTHRYPLLFRARTWLPRLSNSSVPFVLMLFNFTTKANVKNARLKQRVARAGGNGRRIANIPLDLPSRQLAVELRPGPWPRSCLKVYNPPRVFRFYENTATTSGGISALKGNFILGQTAKWLVTFFLLHSALRSIQGRANFTFDGNLKFRYFPNFLLTYQGGLLWTAIGKQEAALISNCLLLYGQQTQRRSPDKRRRVGADSFH